jgi:hypothetical protein
MARKRPNPEHVRLLHGPYTVPALKRGDKATCLYRDGDVIITSWSDARISWPRCRRPGTHGGGSGLLLNEELARAVRCESALAIRYWWGASPLAVWSWRKALGVEKLNEGSAKLRAQLNAKIAAKYVKGKRLPPEQVERRRRTARELGLRPPQRPNGRPWTAEELALLGTAPDEDLAARFGRTTGAVRCQRCRRGVPTSLDRRRRESRRADARRRA